MGYSDVRYLTEHALGPFDGAVEDPTATAVLLTKYLTKPIRIVDFKAFVTTALVGTSTDAVVKVYQADSDGSSNKVEKATLTLVDTAAVGTLVQGDDVNGNDLSLRAVTWLGIPAGKCLLVEGTVALTGGTPAGGYMWELLYTEDPV